MKVITAATSVLVIAALLKGALSDEQANACLLGNWQDQGSVPNSQLMFRIQQDESAGLFALALTPNPQWGTGPIRFDSNTNAIVVFLDSPSLINGKVSSDCSTITWSVPAGAVWVKVPQPEHVHVVFMNHLDVGYASFIANIINEYFDTYFPRAVVLGNMAEVWRKDNNGFIYTTHPWLVNLYFNCPLNLMFNGIKIHCPDYNAMSAFQTAVRKGHITWHAGPMNMQVEFMDEVLFDAGLDIAEALSIRFNVTSPTVLSQRDVPGLTAAAIPVLARKGVKGVSVGVNPGSAPPAVPKIFKWEFGVDSVIALWHAGGYPLNPGSDLQNAGGISVRDCTLAPGTSHALCFAFRTDNTGPPTSLEELDKCFQIIREEFPEATVFASTLDNFISNVNITALPVISNEIGDNWIQGIASDPLKSSTYRAASRGLAACMANKDCDSSDPVVTDAVRFLIKLPEHTWGLPGIHDSRNWSNIDFQNARAILSTYKDNENSWKEQRDFLGRALDVCQGHKLHDYISQSLLDTKPTLPDLSNYKTFDASSVIELQDGKVTIGFNTSTGGISKLVLKHENGSVYTFASDQNQLGVFTYHSYNDSDYTFMDSHYHYYGNAGYSKPGSEIADPESREWPAKVVTAYQSVSDPSSFVMQLKMADDTTHVKYGAPKYIWISVKVVIHSPKVLNAITLEYDMIIINKTATRLPEATMFSFYPSPYTKGGRWEGYLGKIFNPQDSVELNLDLVVKNGSQYQHAVQYFKLAPLSPSTRKQHVSPDRGYIVQLNSTHVPLVCPITNDGRTPTPFPAPLDPIPSGEVIGMAFNLHNNVWNTNYPLYYPFNDEDADFRAKFSVGFYPM